MGRSGSQEPRRETTWALRPERAVAGWRLAGGVRKRAGMIWEAFRRRGWTREELGAFRHGAKNGEGSEVGRTRDTSFVRARPTESVAEKEVPVEAALSCCWLGRESALELQGDLAWNGLHIVSGAGYLHMP